MQLVKGFTLYVNDKLEQLNLKKIENSGGKNLDSFQDFFKKNFTKK